MFAFLYLAAGQGHQVPGGGGDLLYHVLLLCPLRAGCQGVGGDDVRRVVGNFRRVPGIRQSGTVGVPDGDGIEVPGSGFFVHLRGQGGIAAGQHAFYVLRIAQIHGGRVRVLRGGLARGAQKVTGQQPAQALYDQQHQQQKAQKGDQYWPPEGDAGCHQRPGALGGGRGTRDGPGRLPARLGGAGRGGADALGGIPVLFLQSCHLLPAVLLPSAGAGLTLRNRRHLRVRGSARQGLPFRRR